MCLFFAYGQMESDEARGGKKTRPKIRSFWAIDREGESSERQEQTNTKIEKKHQHEMCVCFEKKKSLQK